MFVCKNTVRGLKALTTQNLNTKRGKKLLSHFSKADRVLIKKMAPIQQPSFPGYGMK